MQSDRNVGGIRLKVAADLTRQKETNLLSLGREDGAIFTSPYALSRFV